MAAEMLAPPAGLGVARDPAAPVDRDQVGVARGIRQHGSIGNAEGLFGERDGRGGDIIPVAGPSAIEGDQFGLDLAADHRIRAERAQVFFIERRVEAEEAEMRSRIERS